MMKTLIELIERFPLAAMGVVALVSILVTIIVVLSLLMIFKEEDSPSYSVPTGKRFRTTKNILKFINKH